MTKPRKKAEKDMSKMLLEGELSIYRAAALKATLLETLEQTLELEIDLSAVSELDTAGVQLLMMAKKAAQEKQQQLRLVAHSPAVVEVFEMLNLAAYFGDPLVMPSHDSVTQGRA